MNHILRDMTSKEYLLILGAAVCALLGMAWFVVLPVGWVCLSLCGWGKYAALWRRARRVGAERVFVMTVTVSTLSSLATTGAAVVLGSVVWWIFLGA